MRAVDGQFLSNVAAGTYSFNLTGGIYHWNTKSTGAGTIDLKIYAYDGSTLTAVATQITATAGQQGGMYLPPGQYAIVISGFTANYVALSRVPLD
jgi:hypothetical protein